MEQVRKIHLSKSKFQVLEILENHICDRYTETLLNKIADFKYGNIQEDKFSIEKNDAFMIYTDGPSDIFIDDVRVELLE